MFLSNTHRKKNSEQASIEEILDRAESQSITLKELDFLVNKTRELCNIRTRELQRIQTLLLDLESRRKPY